MERKEIEKEESEVNFEGIFIFSWDGIINYLRKIVVQIHVH